MKTDFVIRISVPAANSISPMLHTHLFMEHRAI